MKVLARSGETLDAVSFRVLKTTSNIDAVVSLNPHLLESETLSSGDVVTLPDNAPVTQPRETVTLWT